VLAAVAAGAAFGIAGAAGVLVRREGVFVPPPLFPAVAVASLLE
jgi:hypothetical protein